MFIQDEVAVPAEMVQLLKDTVSSDQNVANSAKYALAAALTSAPLKKGIFFGDTISGIFSMDRFEPGTPMEFPLDIVSPADVKFHIAYTVPDTGFLPHRTIASDYIAIKPFMVATTIDWSVEMARYARWNIVARALEAADAAIIRKRNNDGFHTLISAAVDRGISVADTSIATGLFGKRLVALAQGIMRRNGGGNSTSVGRSRLTHIALSPESLADMRSWDLTQVDDVTRREIFLAGDDVYSLTKIFGVTLIDIDEFGVGQEYQKYYNNTLGATTPSSKEEIALGLDLSNGLKNSFIMPWVPRENGQFIEMTDRPSLIEFYRRGYALRCKYGVAVLNNIYTLLLAI